MDYIAHQAPLSMWFPRQEYRSGLPSPSPGDFPDPRIEPVSPISSALQADSLHIENISFKNEDGAASLENTLTVLPKEKWKSVHTHKKIKCSQRNLLIKDTKSLPVQCKLLLWDPIIIFRNIRNAFNTTLLYYWMI